MPKKYFIQTYGCQMNELDSLQVGRLLSQEGFQSTTEASEADVVLINTCSIREKASHKVYSDVGRFRGLKKKNPQMVLGVIGCQAQAEGPHLQKRFPYLDLVVGPDHLRSIPQLVFDSIESRASKTVEVDFYSRDDFQFVDLLPQEEENHLKAFINIMKGCDNFCSFCIVPFVRGREVCRKPEEIIEEVKGLVQLGVQEVTLLGQNVNSYGMGRHAKIPGSISFAQLLQRISEETSIQRIRFTTSHPKDLSEELIEQFATNPKLAKHFHLPIQSGSNSTLEKMYRGYTRESYLEQLDKLKKACPDVAITSDIIVGFCGESEEDFQATMDLLEEVRYDSIYSFTYSPRPKTTAALYFQNDVPEEEKQERLKKVQELQSRISFQKNQEQVGMTFNILVEAPSKFGDTWFGRSSQNHVVHFKGDEADVERFVEVKIVKASPNSLVGEKLCQT